MKTEQTRESHPLARYSPFVTEARKRFFAGLGMIMDPWLVESTEQVFANRFNRLPGVYLLGEYAPRLLADLLEIHWTSLVERVAAKWYGIYAFTIITDDMMDRQTDYNKVPKELYIAAPALLADALISIVSEYPDMTAVLRSSFRTVSDAAIHEITWHGDSRVRLYGSKSIEAIGKKNSFLLLCAALMLRADGRQLESATSTAIEHIATGMQLIDDLTDVREDVKDGSMTYPLTEAARTLIPTEGDKSPFDTGLSKGALEMVLVCTGAAEKTVQLALHHLVLAIERLPGEDNPGKEFIRQTVDGYRALEQSYATRREMFGSKGVTAANVFSDSTMKRMHRFDSAIEDRRLAPWWESGGSS